MASMAGARKGSCTPPELYLPTPGLVPNIFALLALLPPMFGDAALLLDRCGDNAAADGVNLCGNLRCDADGDDDSEEDVGEGTARGDVDEVAKGEDEITGEGGKGGGVGEGVSREEEEEEGEVAEATNPVWKFNTSATT